MSGLIREASNLASSRRGFGSRWVYDNVDNNNLTCDIPCMFQIR